METKAGLPAEALAKAGPKDIFLHLLSIIALYVSAGSFVALIFDYINIWLPDPVSENYYSLLSAYSSARWSIATLIVVFPVYVWSVRFLNKNYAAFPEKHEMKTRKWLVYFTLFAAAVIIIGDSVMLIYNFLQGELTTRFLLKILTVFAVAGAVFGHYFWEIRREKITLPLSPSLSKGGGLGVGSFLFAYLVIAIVLIAVVSGFFIVGSPKEERARRFDDQRVQHLQLIQSEIINYWIKKAVLPETLSGLNDPIRSINVPKDPESGAEYIYEIKDKENFKLCATFNLPSLDQASVNAPKRAVPAYAPENIYYGNENWAHSQGQVCFDRKIDKDLYKPEKPR